MTTAPLSRFSAKMTLVHALVLESKGLYWAFVILVALSTLASPSEIRGRDNMNVR